MTPAVVGNVYIPVTAQSPVSPSAAAVMSSSPAIGSLPLKAVPSTIAVVEARNNFRGAPAPTGGDKQQGKSQLNDDIRKESGSFLNGVMTNNSRSSSFMAQLLAQDPDSIALRGDTELETANPLTMAVFSNIKYLPSNASKPSLFAMQTQAVEAEGEIIDPPQLAYDDLYNDDLPVSTLSYARVSKSYSSTQSLATQPALIQ